MGTKIYLNWLFLRRNQLPEFPVMYWGITLPENACLRTRSVCPQSVSVTVFPISVSVLMFVLYQFQLL